MATRIMTRLFWYLAKKLDYSIALKVNKDFYYTGIFAHMPNEIVVYFA